LETGREVHTLAGHFGRIYAVAVTPDGKRAVSASWDWMLKVWDLETGIELHTLAGHSGWVSDVAVTADGKRAVSTSDKTMKLWDLETGRELHTLDSGPANGVAVTADGKRAVSASCDKTLKLWDLKTSAVVASFTCDGDVYCGAFTGPRKIVGGDALGRVHFLALEE
jgi:WD40 repeat protein